MWSIKKTKIISAYRLNLFLPYIVCTIKHAASTERDWNKNLCLQQSACSTFTAMARTTELNYNWEYNHTQCINKIYHLHGSYEKPLHCSSIYSIRENNILMRIMCIWRRQKTKSACFANNQQLWIKFRYGSHDKIMDWFCSVGIQARYWRHFPVAWWKLYKFLELHSMLSGRRFSSQIFLFNQSNKKKIVRLSSFWLLRGWHSVLPPWDQWEWFLCHQPGRGQLLNFKGQGGDTFWGGRWF